MTDAVRCVLETIARAKEVPPGSDREILVALPARSAVEAACGAESVQDAIDARLVVAWRGAVTLTPLGAYRAGRVLEERDIVASVPTRDDSGEVGMTRQLNPEPYWTYPVNDERPFRVSRAWGQSGLLPYLFAFLPDLAPPVLSQVADRVDGPRVTLGDRRAGGGRGKPKKVDARLRKSMKFDEVR